MRDELAELAYRLYREKYSTHKWNLRYLDYARDMLDPSEAEALLEIAAPGGVVAR